MFSEYNDDHGSSFGHNKHMNEGERIRKARESAQLTQQELADACGIRSRNAVSQWETGQTTPSFPNYRAIAKKTGFSLLWLIEGVGPEKESQNFETARLENEDLFIECVVAVERATKALGRTIDAKTKATAIVELYKEFSHDKPRDNFESFAERFALHFLRKA